MDLSHGSLENLILNIVWNESEKYNGVMSVYQVWEHLNELNVDKSWAYTTVKTVLDRLVEKGLIDRVKLGKKYLYKEVMPRKEMAMQAIRKLALEYTGNDMNELLKLVKELAYEEERLMVHAYR